MIVDATGFIGNWPYWENKYADPTGDALVSLMDQWNIDKTVVTSLCGIFYDDVQGNNMVFQAVQNHPDRLVPAVTVSILTDKDNQEYMKRCRDQGAKALKLYPLYHGYALENGNPALEKLIESAVELEMKIVLPIRVTMNWGLAALPTGTVLSFLKAHSDIPFLVENFNAGEFLPLVEYARERDNISLAIGALTRYRGIEDMIQAVGDQRVLGACNAPLQYVACGLGKVNGAEISETQRAAVLGENAKIFFGL